MAAKKGDTVKVHYTGKLTDGTVFDSSRQRDPISFTLGEGQIIPGFEKAVEGLEPGQTTSVTIPADDAYGQRDEEAIAEVPRTQLPEGLNPEVGQQLQVQKPDGQPVPVRVTEVTEDKIKIDTNHPLAGKDLAFELELVEIS